MMTELAEKKIRIASFSCLPETTVAESWIFTVEELLSWLERKPTARWKGTHETPGWAPVYYDPPARARDNIKEVYALVLDYDKKAHWDSVVALWAEFYGLIYTTKSHDVGNHRLRVVLPLSRPVTSDEYDRLWIWAKRQSDNAELVTDSQAKDASRFWYMPTPPAGDSWRTQRLGESPLDVDATLPIAEAPQLRVVPAPTYVTTDQKTERARRYLAKIPGAVSGDHGHTQTFHAVATVMFGFDLDPDTTYSLVASDFNPRCDPPWKEKDLLRKVREVAEKCERTRGYLLQSDRRPVYSTQQAADSAPALPEEHDVDWRSGCAFKKDNTFKRAYVNITRVVAHHPEYRGKWSLNTMTSEVWFDGAPMSAALVHAIRARADHILGYTVPAGDVEAAIAAAAEQRPFHPVQQYIRSVDWDGVERLASMARDFLGSELRLHSEMVRRWMIGAVARAMNPGCKLDTALMLYGAQGLFKSTFFAVLGDSWHADSPIDIANKDSFQQIHAAWIYEFSELENVVTGKAESRLKAFITSTHDMYRAPYARAVLRKARAVALCGTTNRRQILTDDTGSRRFWIVPVSQPIDIATLTEVRDQLWAEAFAAYESGEPWWLDADLENEREGANEDFAEEDSWMEHVSGFLAQPSRLETTIADVLENALKVDIARQDRWSQMRVARLLARLGWHRDRESRGDRRWRYMRPETQVAS